MYTFDADIPIGCDRGNRHKHCEEDHLGVFGTSGATETQLGREGWVEVCRGTGKAAFCPTKMCEAITSKL